jgi:AcrR family transcriptional regulator
MDEVATRAGLTRPTLYRYFPSKDALLAALVIRESERFLDGVRAAFAATDDLDAALESSLLFVLRHARVHPLLDRLLADDPEILLPYLTTRGLPVFRRAAQVVADLIAEREPRVPPPVAFFAAEAMTRLLVSYVLTPDPEPVEQVASSLAQLQSSLLSEYRRPMGPKPARPPGDGRSS